MTVSATHDRDDDSAWKGNGGLAFVTGLIVGAFRYGNIVLGYRLETFKGYV